jgi:hypothetical protein
VDEVDEQRDSNSQTEHGLEWYYLQQRSVSCKLRLHSRTKSRLRLACRFRVHFNILFLHVVLSTSVPPPHLLLTDIAHAYRCCLTKTDRQTGPCRNTYSIRL